jgi:hypothetical protein
LSSMEGQLKLRVRLCKKGKKINNKISKKDFNS